uniref:MORN repeat-containing protein 5 n=1 Tax=Glossina brevipalpis TaxID=37001 RepID=A0A1A9WUR7_9MUSC
MPPSCNYNSAKERKSFLKGILGVFGQKSEEFLEDFDKGEASACIGTVKDVSTSSCCCYYTESLIVDREEQLEANPRKQLSVLLTAESESMQIGLENCVKRAISTCGFFSNNVLVCTVCIKMQPFVYTVEKPTSSSLTYAKFKKRLIENVSTTNNFRFLRGSRYTGNWANVIQGMEGYGVYNFPDGSEYRGYFLKGFFHCKGLLRLAEACYVARNIS